MIKVIIIDDETKAQDTLELMLDRYLPGKFEVLAKCGSVDEGLREILVRKLISPAFLSTKGCCIIPPME